MDQRLVRIRELINQKEAIDTELAGLIGARGEIPKRGRPRKAEASDGAFAPSENGAMADTELER
ncbi:hypothetical protein [Bradyrhizobium sp.]|uniref:hypothetical protein n=1 Tax=Bradyrhizobium sp. TaxID=376 RepID=UPI0039E2F1C8